MDRNTLVNILHILHILHFPHILPNAPPQPHPIFPDKRLHSCRRQFFRVKKPGDPVRQRRHKVGDFQVECHDRTV